MPLSKIQIDILRLLAAHRDPESYVAGATPLNRNTTHYSCDIDIFHDREERVAAAALQDLNVLAAAGYHVAWLRQLPLLYTVEVTQGNASTRLEWVVDSDYRFFPTMRDETFGYVLHPADLAMHKVMAAAGRREVRAVLTEDLLDSQDISTRLRAALDEVEAFVAQMPTDKMGLLFLQDGKVVQLAPDHLEAYATHAGQRRGHWPTSPDIADAMYEHYKKWPSPS